MRRRTCLIWLAILGLGAAPARLLAQSQEKSFSPEALDQMMAPIALYPDSLLSQVLMAATYPLEVVEAARWSKANPNPKGDAAVNAVKDQDWDVSVKSLVAFPSVLQQMNDHLDWTQKIGDAMLAQQQDVADAIQRLRAKAAAAGNLKSTPQQTVSTQGSGDNVQYVIAPTNPEVVYVPSYNPSWAYGAWPYPANPPAYYPLAGALATGFFFGAGVAAAGALFGGWNWAGRGNSYVNVNVNRAVNIDNHFDRNRYTAGNNHWQHDPDHRRGVAYRTPATRAHFGQARPGAAERQQFRGQLASRPGANLPAGQRPSQHTGGGLANIHPGQAGGGTQHPAVQNRAAIQQRAAATRSGGGAFSGVNRGQQINREAARGRAMQSRAASHPMPARGGGFRGGRR